MILKIEECYTAHARERWLFSVRSAEPTALRWQLRMALRRLPPDVIWWLEQKRTPFRGGPAMSHPCVRGICRRCGKKSGIFGILGFRLSQRFHEKHCGVVGPVCTTLAQRGGGVNEEAGLEDAVAESQHPLEGEAGPTCQGAEYQDATRPGLLAAARLLVSVVDTSVDPRDLHEEDLLRLLYVSKEQMLRMQAADRDTTEELMRVAIVSWKPGIDEQCPLKAALAHGPAEGDCVVVKARPPRMRVLFQQTVDVHSLADTLPKRVDVDELLEFGQDFRDVAIQRCLALQQLAKRLSISLMASNGGG